MLLGEAPGYNENISGKPFQGRAGQLLDKVLNSVGISRTECIIANVARKQPPANNISHFFVDSKRTIPKKELALWVEELRQEILLYKPNIVICLGATALWAMTGLKAISKYRGFIMNSTLVPGQKVLATYHPAAILRQWNLHFTVTLDLRKAYINSLSPEIAEDKRNLTLNPSVTTYLEYLDFLLHEHQGSIAVDIEVRNPGSHLEIIGISHDESHAVSFNFLNANKSKFSLEVEQKILYKLAKVLARKSLIMHNGSYDKGVLWYNNAILCNLKFDTMIACHVLWPESPRSLSFLTSIFLNTPEWKSTSMSAPEYYNANDAINTYNIFEPLMKELEKQNLFETFNSEMEQVDPALFMQLNGAYVDKGIQQKLINELKPELEQLQSFINQEAGRPVNINSPKQLHQLLYSDMMLPPQYKRRKSVREKRKITTDQEALGNLIVKYPDNKVLSAIKKSKKLYKLLNSFVDIELSPDSKVHTSYNVTGATMANVTKHGVFDDEGNYKSFGRWSSSKSIILTYGSGNLQNIPKQARLMYTAPEGYEYIQVDYAQAEAVVIAYIIGDVKLINMFEKAYGLRPSEKKERGYDIHRITASEMFKVALEEVTKEQRKLGKRVRHAVNYDAGPGVLAASLGCSQKEAKLLLQIFYNGNPQLTVYRQNVQNQLAKNRTLVNLFGRKHRFFDRWGSSLFKSAYAYVPQSTVGDLLNKALTRYYNTYCKQTTIVFQLHDAIYVLSPLGRRAKTLKNLRECLTIPLTYKSKTFYIDCDFSAGPSWGETEELDYSKEEIENEEM
jgi:uracil-DNA glycosylase family 4